MPIAEITRSRLKLVCLR